MNSDPSDHSSEPSDTTDADRKLEQEILGSRKYSLEEAIGRLAGDGMMKGVSPVARREQSEAELDDFLGRAMSDASPVLTAVLARQVKASELFLKGFEQPIAVLTDYVRQILASEYLLQELVRQTDVEWGREFGERPYFERPGRPPHADDPFTFESVRRTLTTVAERLGESRRGA